MCVSVSVCVTFIVFTDCESCTRPISTNPASMEAGEYGRTRGTWFSRAVSRWSRSPGCCGFRGVFGWGAFFLVFFFFRYFFFSERTRPAASTRPPCLIYLSNSKGCDNKQVSYCSTLKTVPVFHAMLTGERLPGVTCVSPRASHWW